MRKHIIGANVSRLFAVILILITAFAADCFADQKKFGDWVCMEETDPTTNEKSKKIGTAAKDGVSSLWVAESGLGKDTIQLTLKSNNIISSEHITYRVDKDKALTLSTALRTCESYCLTEYVARNGELIKAMKKGYRMTFEYDTYPDITNHPTFSLIGFTKAANWLLSE
ncbi:MAG: invasion associated locus B family protein [Desulfobacterales bacterium]|nr:MAG: invasion associated locus B family protein [Desulfobacterales bacterium]